MGDRSEKYKSDEEKLLIAKVEDKYNFCRTRNKITYTDFLNMQEINLVKKYLQEQHIKNYLFLSWMMRRRRASTPTVIASSVS